MLTARDWVILGACSLVIWLGLFAVGVPQRLARIAMAMSELAPPIGLWVPRVVQGAGSVSKTAFMGDPRLGRILGVKVQGPAGPQSPGVVVVGRDGVAFADRAGRLIRAFRFPGRVNDVDIVETRAGGPLQFLTGGVDRARAVLIDDRGAVTWRYEGPDEFREMVAGDIDGTGTIEFIVALRSGGLIRMDREGHRRWSVADDRPWWMTLVDTSGDGTLKVVYLDARDGRVKVRDGRGEPASEGGTAWSNRRRYSLSPWPGKQGPWRVLTLGDRRLRILDLAGGTLAELPAPAARAARPWGAPVRLDSRQPEHFALAAGYAYWKRSVLYIYSAAGALAYQEVLGEDCGPVAALPGVRPPAEALLLACGGKVWRYDLTAK